MNGQHDEAPEYTDTQPLRRALVADEEESHRRDHRLGDGFAPTQFDEFFKDEPDDDELDSEKTPGTRSPN